MTTNLDREAIKGSPPYDANAVLDRNAEVVIYNYDLNGYWQEKRDRAAG